MNRKGHDFGLGRVAISAALLLGFAISQTRSFAQDEYSTPPPAPETQLRPAAELDQLLGPIALYPDPLIGIILPAATVPAQIVTADRYVQGGGDTNQISVQPWDPSVQDLAHYPTVLKWMDDNLTWTTEIGVAFATQQNDVMDSIQRLRSQAQALGNLQTTPQENVESDDGDIDIDPADPNDMYIPDYQADEIYTQPGVYCTFGLGLPIGGWLGFDWDWRRHHLITWTHDHPRPPDWWHRKPGGRRSEIPGGSGNLWRPQSRPASIIVAGAGDRGYEARGGVRPAVAPKVSMPRGEAPRVESRGGVQPGVTVIGRQEGESRPPEGVTVIGRSEGESSRGRAVEPRVEEPTESAFGGFQSSREVRQSSSRGEESRGISTGGGRSGGGGGRR